MADKNETARKLAEAHYRCEPGLVKIFRLRAAGDAELQANEPVKLLEVNDDTISAGIVPLQFGPRPSSGIEYPSVIVEITPDELDRIQSGELLLPNSWRLDDLLPRSFRDRKRKRMTRADSWAVLIRWRCKAAMHTLQQGSRSSLGSNCPGRIASPSSDIIRSSSNSNCSARKLNSYLPPSMITVGGRRTASIHGNPLLVPFLFLPTTSSRILTCSHARRSNASQVRERCNCGPSELMFALGFSGPAERGSWRCPPAIAAPH